MNQVKSVQQKTQVTGDKETEKLVNYPVSMQLAKARFGRKTRFLQKV